MVVSPACNSVNRKAAHTALSPSADPAEPPDTAVAASAINAAATSATAPAITTAAGTASRRILFP